MSNEEFITLNKLEIQEFYKDSKLFKTMFDEENEDEDEDEEISVPISKYENFNFNFNTRYPTKTKIKKYINVFNYWEFEDYPEFFKRIIVCKYNINNFLDVISEDMEVILDYVDIILDLFSIYMNPELLGNITRVIYNSEYNSENSKYNTIDKLNNHKRILNYIYNNFNTNLILNLGTDNTHVKIIRNVKTYLDYITEDYISLNDGYYNYRDSDSIRSKHSWLFNFDIDLDEQSNKIISDLIDGINVDTKYQHGFKLLGYVSRQSTNRIYDFSLYEYFIIACCISKGKVEDFNFLRESNGQFLHVSDLLKIFEAKSEEKISMDILFYTIHNELNTLTHNVVVHEDESELSLIEIADTTAAIIKILLEVNSKYYLPQLNEYCDWKNVNQLNPTILYYIKVKTL